MLIEDEDRETNSNPRAVGEPRDSRVKHVIIANSTEEQDEQAHLVSDKE